MIDEIIANVKNVWGEFGFDYPFPQDMTTFLQSRNRIILFFIDTQIGYYPQVIVKLNRPNANVTWSEDYARNSQKIRGMLDGAIKKTIPRMKVFQLQDSIPGVIEKGIPGYPINVNTNIRESDFHNFAEWLLVFQSYCSINQTKITSEFIEKLIERIDSQYLFSDEINVKISEILYPLIGVQTNTGWVVGDTHPSNILINNNVVSGVLDWEGVSDDKLAFYDWYQFIFSIIIEYVKATSKSQPHAQIMKNGFDLLFNVSTSKIGNMLNRQTEFFLISKGLPPELKLNLFILFLFDYYWIKNKRILLNNLLPRILS